MMRVSTFFLLTTLSLSEGSSWSYDFDDKTGGPWQWGALQGSFCGSNQKTSEQSPINICGAKIDEGLALGAEDTWKYVNDLTVENNGHTIQVNFDSTADPPTTVNSLADKLGRTTGAGDITWEASQVHFHFGRTGKTDEGSEHYINSKAYPMEAHFVHFNTKYKDVGDAVASGNKDALLVIGVVLSVTAQESAFVTAVGNAVAGATKTAAPLTTQMGDFAKFAEANMLAQDAMFSTYAGSLTTPTCNEIVTWVVMDRSCMVTAATLAKFWAASSNPSRRRLRSLSVGAIGDVGNFRRIQAWNYGVIWSNSQKSVGITSCPMSKAERMAWQTTANNCPLWGQYFLSFCDGGPGGACDRDTTAAEATAICKEFAEAKCGGDSNAQKNLEPFCTKYAWVVTYPDCPMGYWDSGCGQEASKQKASGVSCMGYKVSGGNWWMAKDASDCTATKPDFKSATDKACPATPPCVRCKGCKRNGDCWAACDTKSGLCDKCNSADGRKGACCMPKDSQNSAECNGMNRLFPAEDVHTCFVKPVEKEDCRKQLCNDKAGMCDACDADGRQGACCMPGSNSDPSECGIAAWIADKKDVYSCALLPGDKSVGSALGRAFARLTALESK